MPCPYAPPALLSLPLRPLPRTPATMMLCLTSGPKPRKLLKPRLSFLRLFILGLLSQQQKTNTNDKGEESPHMVSMCTDVDFFVVRGKHPITELHAQPHDTLFFLIYF
jgi:hypothetical protein